MPLLNRKPFEFGPTKPEALGLAAEEEVKSADQPLSCCPEGPRPIPDRTLAAPGGQTLHRCAVTARPGLPAAACGGKRAASPPALRPHPPLPALAASLQVFVVKATGEVFRTYEAYLKQIELYRQAVWSCRYSGKGGLTLEEAQEAERKAVAALQAVSRAGSKAAQRLPAHQFA